MGGEWSKAVGMIFKQKYSAGRGKLQDAMKDPETKVLHEQLKSGKKVHANKTVKSKAKKGGRWKPEDGPVIYPQELATIDCKSDRFIKRKAYLEREKDLFKDVNIKRGMYNELATLNKKCPPVQHYPPGTQEIYNSFSSRNLMMENGKKLKFTEGREGVRGNRGVPSTPVSPTQDEDAEEDEEEEEDEEDEEEDEEDEEEDEEDEEDAEEAEEEDKEDVDCTPEIKATFEKLLTMDGITKEHRHIIENGLSKYNEPRGGKRQSGKTKPGNKSRTKKGGFPTKSKKSRKVKSRRN